MIKILEKCFLRMGIPYSVYSNYLCGDSLQDILSSMCALLNKVIDNVNEYNKIVDALKKWIEEEGLQIAVDKKLEEMIDDGTFDNIINQKIFADLSSKVEKILDNHLTISVKDFGAKGDGVTDDTEAFKNANIYANEIANKIENNQLVSYSGITILIPNGIYKVSGDRILGSVRNSGEFPNIKAIRYEIKSDNATLLWDTLEITDRLFYFDYTITKPTITNLNIFVINEGGLYSSGTVFYLESIYNGQWLGDSSNGFYQNIRVVAGRNKLNTLCRPKSIFKIVGNTMCDQSLVVNCSFEHFVNIFDSDNSQAVNWVFHRCQLYSNLKESIYFKFSKMNDNFIVRDCSFSAFDGQTILQANAELNSNNKITERPDYNFIFDSNRVECYSGNGTDYLNVFEGNFGKLIMTNTNFRLGATSGNVKQRFLATSHANYKLDNVILTDPIFSIPLIDSPITGLGNADYVGVQIIDCQYFRDYFFKIYDPYTKTLSNVSKEFYNNIVKYVFIRNLRKINSNIIYNYDIMNNNKYLGGMNVEERTIIEGKEGSCMGYYITIPPYQTINKIELLNITKVPTQYSKFRIYFGDKTNNKYIDCENIKPDTLAKAELLLFEGLASIFYDDLSLNKIYITCIKSDGNEEPIGGLARITFSPLNVHSMRLTEQGITVNQKAKNIFIGGTNQRPTSPYPSMYWFDITLNKPIFYDGTNWRDGSGQIV